LKVILFLINQPCILGDLGGISRLKRIYEDLCVHGRLREGQFILAFSNAAYSSLDGARSWTFSTAL